MVKASALYIVIIIALVIAVLCSSLIVAAYFYKSQYQRKFRYDLLHSTVNSGINILLAGDDQSYSEKRISLFGGDQDSVILKRVFWGLYDVDIVRSFIQADTLTRVFSVANNVDSAKWAALYLIDEDRPLSVSGKTEIRGNAFIPKAGIKEAYVDNAAYEGDKKLVLGIKKDSEKALPPLNESRLKDIRSMFSLQGNNDSSLVRSDSVFNSFNSKLKYLNLKKQAYHVTNSLNGYILLQSDTTITLDSTARLNNTIICARSILVKEGFNGTCQLFAIDSIHVEKNCVFNYPSSIGVLQFDSSVVKTPQKIVIDAGTIVNGTVFTYQKSKSEVKPIISLGDHTKITGQVYSQGILNYKKQIEIAGSVFTSRFIYQSTYTRYENYLINVKINSDKLSRYYLSSSLMPVSTKKQGILQWLK